MWEEYLSLAHVPETCDFAAGSAGETTKDVLEQLEVRAPGGVEERYGAGV